MTNLTDPKLAQLIARYRVWVEEENQRIAERYERNAQDQLCRYEEMMAEYSRLSWWQKRRAWKPSYPYWKEWVSHIG